MQFPSIAAIFLTILVGQGLASPARGNGGLNNNASSKEGQPCTGIVSNLEQKGTCNRLGECSIEIPPNEVDNVPSGDCK
ncbi:uncharacterized protein CTRU02_208363 [Colletotrichum truncatum]|uniref:Uncharacterized protein n=1 Tax=Colletotrichum truncatum TaxID=5467 RepID=A0ACC3YW35_COLTU|nr:uncharacterized protein CTRU02_07451 [Colletotrichum truncatum]KAF6791111.1 hypothetical protein CTRU02_07451 [Colletotrichum truncatum]